MKAVRKYQEIVVGRPGLWNLFRHELATLVGPVPGAFGLVLREWAYRGILGSMGRGVSLGRNTSIRGAHRIHLGAGVLLDEMCALSARGEPSGVRIGDKTLVARGAMIHARNGTVEIADEGSIGAYCRIATGSRIQIGRHALLAARCDIGGENHGTEDLTVPISKQGMRRKGGVIIGNDVWLGVRATVLDGVRIGRGCIVGAHSMVTKDLPDFAIAVGVPARVLRLRTDDVTEAPGRGQTIPPP